MTDAAGLWADARAAAALFAVDPGLGVAVRSGPGPARDAWLGCVRPHVAPWRRVPADVAVSRLQGGVDLAATLAAGRMVRDPGLLAEEGTLVLAMAERLPAASAAFIAHSLPPSPWGRGDASGSWGGNPHPGPPPQGGRENGVIALDEGVDDERPPDVLLDRLAFWLDLSALPRFELAAESRGTIAAARARLGDVATPDAPLEALCGTAAALGIASLRAPLLALRAARAAAALAGRDRVIDEDAALAARLVLAPRARALPSDAPDPTPPPPPPPPPPEAREESEPHPSDQTLEDLLLAAATAAIPPGLLAALRAGATRTSGRQAGKAGAVRRSGTVRGRPAGTRAGDPRRDGRLDILATLTAAAPWQALRAPAPHGGIALRRADFRVVRRRPRAETTTIFAVDASGSAALHRLAEAKGAVELLLAECYIRRDRVAVIAFRGRAASLLLPPTRSLLRAKRGLAGLPGGGATPLAAALDMAAGLAGAARRRSETPTLVLLTDGRTNVARDGEPGRGRAEEDALAAARHLRGLGIGALLVDTAPRPQPFAARIAEVLAARYLPLPSANAASLAAAARQAARP